MEGPRLRILQLLQKNGPYTVDGLAKAIGLAPATIRRHLDILQRDRLVAFKQVRKKTGRPEYSFYLTDYGQEALPKDYDKLLGMFVRELSALDAKEIEDRNGYQVLELVCQRLSAEVSRSYSAELVGKDLGRRLATLIGHLESEDFSPEADVVNGSIQIKLHNCPFRSVALQNKAVCAFDFGLVSSFLELDVDREECIHDGDSGCTYRADIAQSDEKQLVESMSV